MVAATSEVPARGVTLSVVGRGKVLAGRYRLLEQLTATPDGAVWRALDSTLDRRVAVRVTDTGHEHAADVADAARRAALVDDPRLVRVLDVGSDPPFAYVVAEDVEGDSLAALMDRGPLPAELVRRIVGEAAEALARAASRGLHHLELTPRSVVVRPDGAVKVLGTAVDAAAVGHEPDDPAAASRADARALTALLYAGLTGLWPLGDPEYPAAPRTDGGVVPPADLVPDVPNDLDTLCAVTLGRHDDGPTSPHGLAQQLAPWPAAEDAPAAPAPRRPSGPAATGRPAVRTVDIAALEAGNATTLDVTAAEETRPVRSAATGVTGAGAATAGSAPPAPAGTGSTAGSAATDPEPRVRAGATAARVVRPAATAGGAAAGAAGAAGGSAARPTTTTPSTTTPSTTTPSTTTPSTASPGPSGSTGSPGPVSGTRQTPGAAAGPRPTPGDGSTDRTGAAASGPARDAGRAAGGGPAGARTAGSGTGAPATPGRPHLHGRNQSRGDLGGNPLLPWSDAWGDTSPAPEPVPPTGPFPVVVPPEQPPEEQSRFVIGVIAAGLVLVLVVAVFSLRDLLGGGDDGATPSGPAFVAPTTPGATAPAEQTPAPAPTPTESAEPGTEPRIAAIRAIDPEGDGDENTDRAPRAVDNDPDSTWRSSGYKSAAFGGLKKGVGLAIRLEEAAVVRQVEIDVVGSGGRVEVRTADGPDTEDSTVIGASDIGGDTVSITADDADASRYVLIWFTELPRSEGTYRAEVAEVRLK